jgi:hypothetical protein
MSYRKAIQPKSFAVKLFMPPKHKPAAKTQSQIDFSARTPKVGDLVQRKGTDGTYQILAISSDGKYVTLNLMHGGYPTNLQLPRIPVEGIVFL